jgi:hypothetical protein
MVGKMVFGERILTGLLMGGGRDWLVSPRSHQLEARLPWERSSIPNAFWEGLKLIFKIRSSEPLAPVARALVILEPLLSGVRTALLRSAIQSRRTDSDPFVRASFAVFQAFGGEIVN